MRTYEFTGEQINHRGITLKQIRRLSDGLIGGYIEKEENLSQDGPSFVYDNAKVYGNARIYHNAVVYDDASVYNDAEVFDNAKVFGNVRVFGNAEVYDDASVYNDARVFGNAKVYGNAEVYNDAEVFGNAKVFGNARVFGNAEVYDDASVYNDAEVYGSAKVYGFDKVSGKIINLIGICQFNITASKVDDYIRVGCKSHSVMEWLSYIYSEEKLYLKDCANELEHYKCINQILNIINLWEMG